MQNLSLLFLLMSLKVFPLYAAELQLVGLHATLARLSEARPLRELEHQSFKPPLYFDWQGRLARQPTMKDAFYQDIADNKYQNNLIPARSQHDHICRVITFNVHFWNEGACGGKSIESIKQTALGKVDADIAVLQEVKFTQDCSRRDLYKKMAYLGYKFKGNSLNNHCWLGKHSPFQLANLVAARAVPWAVSAHSFTEPISEQRGFVRMEVDLKDLGASQSRHLVVYGTHLDVSDRTDETRIQEMFELLKQAQADVEQEKLVIIAGDMNALYTDDYEDIHLGSGKSLLELVIESYKQHTGIAPESQLIDLVQTAGFVDCFTKANIPGPLWTCLPATRIDRIFVNKAWDLPIRVCYAYFTPESDHLLIGMDFQVA